MNDNTYDNIREKEISDEVIEKKVSIKCEGSQIYILVQIIVCTIIVLAFILLKNFSKENFDMVCNWYNEKLNDSLIIDNSIDGYREAFSNIINCKDINDEFDLSKSCSVVKNDAGFPMCLSVTPSAPLAKGIITSNFGLRELDGENKMHYGLDIGADAGEAIPPIFPGTVKAAGEDQIYGKYVIINHDNNIETLYAHCSKLNAHKGDKVSVEDHIADVGDTGNSTGNHLHLELRVNGENYDPKPLLKGLYNDI